MKQTIPNPTSVLVPIGKAKGLTVKDFCEIYPETARWMTTVPSIRDQHPVFHQTIVQYVQTSDTPEHNAHQVLFLDTVYRSAFVETAIPGFIDRPYKDLEATLKTHLAEARLDMAEAWANKNVSDQELEAAERNLCVCQQRLMHLLKRAWVTTESQIEFERKGIDVSFTLWADLRYPDDVNVTDLPKPLQKISAKAICDVEIKPRMGEDFPSVLRQMKHNKARYLFLGEYTGLAATIDQVRDIFATCNKVILFKSDVDAEYRRLMGQPSHEVSDDVEELQYILD